MRFFNVFIFLKYNCNILSYVNILVQELGGSGNCKVDLFWKHIYNVTGRLLPHVGFLSKKMLIMCFVAWLTAKRVLRHPIRHVPLSFWNHK